MENPDPHWQKWFEDIWADREEHLYRHLFGDLGPGIFNLSQKTFDSLGIKEVDPRFFFHGVFECPPCPTRNHWLYVSSGMSNPWGAEPFTTHPDDYSGLGYEFTLHTPEQSTWALHLIHWTMA